MNASQAALRRGMLAPLIVLLAACAGGAPTASPTPAVVELPLRTVESNACPEALMADVRLVVDLDTPGALVAVDSTGDRYPLTFRVGTRATARLDQGVIELVMPEGDRAVVGRDDRVSFGGGSLGGEGDSTFFACSLVQ